VYDFRDRAWRERFDLVEPAKQSQQAQTGAGAAWLGHSGRVSEKHYLMIPDALWDKAARWADPSAAKCAA